MKAIQCIKGAKTLFSYQSLCVVFFLIAVLTQGGTIIPNLFYLHQKDLQLVDKSSHSVEVRATTRHSFSNELDLSNIIDDEFIHEERLKMPTGLFSLKYCEPKRSYLAVSIYKETHYRAQSLHFYRAEIDDIYLDTLTESLLEKLEYASAFKKEISFLALFSHGSPNTIWGSGGIILQTQDLDALQMLVQSGRVRFAEDAVIYLGGCNAGTEHKGKCFAQKLADVTGVSVYALVEDSVRPIFEDPGEGGYPRMTYGPQHKPNSQFNIFTPLAAPHPIGSQIDLIKLFDKIRIKQDKSNCGTEEYLHPAVI